MSKFHLILGAILVFCLAGQPSWAEKAYVTDTFDVTLRTGPSNENKIIAMPISGQPVEILDSKDEWNYVRLLDSGETPKEGWMLSRYLITRLPWRMQAMSLKNENAQLKEKLTRIEEQLAETIRHEQELTKNLQARTEAFQKVHNDYESLKRGSADYLKLKELYNETRDILEASQKEAERLTKENEILRISQRNKWLATGAVVLLCGLLIGLLIGRREKKRRSSLSF